MGKHSNAYTMCFVNSFIFTRTCLDIWKFCTPIGTFNYISLQLCLKISITLAKEKNPKLTIYDPDLKTTTATNVKMQITLHFAAIVCTTTKALFPSCVIGLPFRQCCFVCCYNLIIKLTLRNLGQKVRIVEVTPAVKMSKHSNVLCDIHLVCI